MAFQTSHSDLSQKKPQPLLIEAYAKLIDYSGQING